MTKHGVILRLIVRHRIAVAVHDLLGGGVFQDFCARLGGPLWIVVSPDVCPDCSWRVSASHFSQFARFYIRRLSRRLPLRLRRAINVRFHFRASWVHDRKIEAAFLRATGKSEF